MKQDRTKDECSRLRTELEDTQDRLASVLSVGSDVWHLDFRPDQVNTIQEILEFAMTNLHNGIASDSFDGLARRLSYQQVKEISDMISDATS